MSEPWGSLEGLARAQEADEARERAAAQAAAETLATELGRTEGAAAVLLVPSGAGRLVGPDPRRIARLRAHLEGLEAGAARGELDARASDDVALDGAPAACAVCRGFCCRFGGDVGYLDAESMARAAAEWDDPVCGLVALVPAETMSGSCIFHGAEGCGLPRRLRAEPCNEYVCAAATAVEEAVEQAAESAPGAVWVAAARRGAVTRIQRLGG